MMIIGVILAALAVLILIVVLRAVMLKPTEAKEAKVKLDTSQRSVEYGKRLAKMIQKETISCLNQEDRSKFYEFHEVLEELFPNVHKNCEKHVFDGSLLFKWSGKSSQNPILFMSHQDVVEAGGTWEHAPFSGDIDEEGRVWGRGTVDTKGSLFCIFTAIEELIGEGYQPEVDVYIGSSCTEEWSGDGAPATVEYLKEQGIELALVLDEGGMIIEEPIGGVKGTYGMVGVVEKGYGDVKFTARSNGGHASAPKKNSPLVRLGKFMVDVEKHSPFVNKFTPTLDEMFRRCAPNMDFGMKVIFANMWLFKPLLEKLLPSINSVAGAMIHTTLAFTTAKGSDGLNVLPQEAYVTGNMRFSHHQPNEESIKAVSEIAKKYDIETEIICQDPPCPIVDYNSNAFRLVEETAKEMYPGIGICPYIMTGGTDAKYYSEVSKNCIRFAPLYIDGQQYGSIHALNENIYQGTLPMGVDFYKNVVKKSR
ncbi:M20/M25/M40 family metallo-hydrolase [bacterium]|nr:M20/M25/M40 family metallo-hydrolase [bacterium]MDY4502686.1 M20/M25/M40 family metallo-hydrolase [Bariatricus sp.]